MDDQSDALDHIIAPLSRTEFFSHYWDKSFLHRAGAPGRFQPLLSWDELNNILAWHGPLPPQLRLFQDGRQVDVSRYVSGQPGALRLEPGGLTACLAQGATLILDQAEKLAPQIGALAAEMAQILKGDVNVNLYAGWCRQNGFDLHWDEQDLFVLQLSGRKHWKVHAPTRPHPLTDDEPPPRPTGPPLWDGILEDGSMLYVPRGFWHVAWPLDEPSLHLTVSVAPPNGAEFLKWWARRLTRHPQLRRNLPPDASAEQRRNYLNALTALLTEDAGGDPLGQFLEEREAGRKPLAAFDLPRGPLHQRQPLSPMTRLRLAGVRRLVFAHDVHGVPSFHAGAGSWSFPPDLLPVFEKLSAEKTLTFAEASAGISDPRALAQLTHAFNLLAEAGILLKES